MVITARRCAGDHNESVNTLPRVDLVARVTLAVTLCLLTLLSIAACGFLAIAAWGKLTGRL